MRIPLPTPRARRPAALTHGHRAGQGKHLDPRCATRGASREGARLSFSAPGRPLPALPVALALTRGPQPVLAPASGEEPVAQVAEKTLEGVGDVVHVVLALLQAHAAGVAAQHLQQAGGLRVLPALAVNPLGRQPWGRAEPPPALSAAVWPPPTRAGSLIKGSPRGWTWCSPPCRCSPGHRGAVGRSQAPLQPPKKPEEMLGEGGKRVSGCPLPWHVDGVTQTVPVQRGRVPHCVM